jgi:hypothetical protein
MQIRTFESGEPVFFKYKERHLKLAICLQGRLIGSKDSDLFLRMGHSYGAAEIYQSYGQRNTKQQANSEHFPANIIADPYCIVAEIKREVI